MDGLIGKSIRISYYDHNESFAPFLPRVGKVTKRFSTANVDDWYLLELAEPFEYQGQEQKSFLLRCKWHGKAISAKEQVAVFILLGPNQGLISGSKIEIEEFNHVAWGFADVIGT